MQVDKHRNDLHVAGSDFNKETLRNPYVSMVVEEWGFRVLSLRWAWTWHGVGAHNGQESMIDFVLAPDTIGRLGVRTIGTYACAH